MICKFCHKNLTSEELYKLLEITAYRNVFFEEVSDVYQTLEEKNFLVTHEINEGMMMIRPLCFCHSDEGLCICADPSSHELKYKIEREDI